MGKRVMNENQYVYHTAVLTRGFLLLFLLVLWPVALSAQHLIHGHVVDEATGHDIPFATVMYKSSFHHSLREGWQADHQCHGL